MKVRWARTAAVSGLQETGRLQEQSEERSSLCDLPQLSWAEAWPLEGSKRQAVQAMMALCTVVAVLQLLGCLCKPCLLFNLCDGEYTLMPAA